MNCIWWCIIIHWFVFVILIGHVVVVFFYNERLMLTWRCFPHVLLWLCSLLLSLVESFYITYQPTEAEAQLLVIYILRVSLFSLYFFCSLVFFFFPIKCESTIIRGIWQRGFYTASWRIAIKHCCRAVELNAAWEFDVNTIWFSFPSPSERWIRANGIEVNCKRKLWWTFVVLLRIDDVMPDTASRLLIYQQNFSQNIINSVARLLCILVWATIFTNDYTKMLLRWMWNMWRRFG